MLGLAGHLFCFLTSFLSPCPPSSTGAPVQCNRISLSDQTPTVLVDTVSAARRLAARGSRFGTSDEVAVTVAGGVATELADELMAALGSRFNTLSGEDVTAIFDLYISTVSVAKTADADIVPEVLSLSNGLK